MALNFPPPFEPIRNGDLAFTIRDLESPPGVPTRYTMIYQTTIEATPAIYGTYPEQVPHEVHEVVLPNGRLPYSHQAEAAVEFLGNGKNLILTTPTASGKTASFLAPTLATISKYPSATALFVYPMNALAADQMRGLVNMGFQESSDGLYELSMGGKTIRAGVLTGDTAQKARGPIRSKAHILITNQVALHHALLAQCHRRYTDKSSWTHFLSHNRILMLDEAHSHRGIQGTHVALIVRRFTSLVHKLSGSSPQIILASATIGNALEHAKNLTGQGNWALVDRSGAASYKRDIFVAMPNPHPKGTGRWAASLVAQDIAVAEALSGRRVLVFSPSRNGTERLVTRLNEELGHDAAVYFHSGLPVEVKQGLLGQILNGQIKIVVSTSALELGVDIGGMDSVVLVGHPGDNASYNQRAGRVGRTSPGRVFLVLDENQHPLNIYLGNNPEALYWPPESRTIYPENRLIATRHAACCFLETKDADLVHKVFPTVVDDDVMEAMKNNPYGKIDPIGSGNFGKFKALAPDGKVIQELGGESALFSWHPRATLRNYEGVFFRVEKVSLREQKVYTCRMDEPSGQRVYTTPEILTEKYPKVETLALLLDIPLKGIVDPVAGEFDVVRTTIGYTELREGPKSSGPNQLQFFHLDPSERNPPVALLTRGVQFSLGADHPLASCLLEHRGGLQAVQDALGRAVGLLVRARVEDVPVELSTEGDTVKFFVFDMAEGGMGWAEQLVRSLDKWLRAAGQGLLKCSCRLKGCPRCSLSPISGKDRKKRGQALVAAGRA